MYNQVDQAFWGEPIVDGKFTLKGCDPTEVNDLYFLDVEHQWGETVKWSPSSNGSTPIKATLKPCGSAKIRLVDDENQPLANRGLNDIPLTRLALRFDDRDLPADYLIPGLVNQSPLEPPQVQQATLDDARFRNLKTDSNGVLTLPTLIPGAPYRLIIQQNLLQFGPHPEIKLKAASGQTVVLKDRVVPKKK